MKTEGWTPRTPWRGSHYDDRGLATGVPESTSGEDRVMCWRKLYLPRGESARLLNSVVGASQRPRKLERCGRAVHHRYDGHGSRRLHSENDGPARAQLRWRGRDARLHARCSGSTTRSRFSARLPYRSVWGGRDVRAAVGGVGYSDIPRAAGYGKELKADYHYYARQSARRPRRDDPKRQVVLRARSGKERPLREFPVLSFPLGVRRSDYEINQVVKQYAGNLSCADHEWAERSPN